MMVRMAMDAHVWQNGKLVEAEKSGSPGDASKTMAHGILSAHGTREDGRWALKFDALASHDITYVGIVQTARASGLREFPVPYVLTNCHNSLCAVGGTINEDDHRFGLSAAVKYGGIFVPAHLAVIHSFMREEFAACGTMMLGSDSHTRYGALGAMGVGEGGPELVKQVLGKPYLVAQPPVIAVYLSGAPQSGVGPHDVALALVTATFPKGSVKNAVLEFIGPGVASLPQEYRNAVDVMTTETTCLSSIWTTDERTRRYFEAHGRPEAYTKMEPGEGALYDGAVFIALDQVRPMIALPFHPANALPIDEFLANPIPSLQKVEAEAAEMGVRIDLCAKLDAQGFHVDQGVIAGCSGGVYDNIVRAAQLLGDTPLPNGDFGLSVYPGSQPAMLALAKAGYAAQLMASGAVLRTAFCGPCFGAGDVPANGGFSIRHSTRNFPSREGAKPGQGQMACVALMDARSIAATAANGGVLCAATGRSTADETQDVPYTYDRAPYAARLYQGWQKAQPDKPLVFGPNIADWPVVPPMPENLALRVVSVLTDPVTTTDELIPSGETSSYRSNPEKLSEFTLSRKDPGYVARAKAVRAGEFAAELEAISKPAQGAWGSASVVFAYKPGDGSAREQAASCQRVLGGGANIAREYATKRYRSNVVNWGMLPFICDEGFTPQLGDWVLLPGIRALLQGDGEAIEATLTRADGTRSQWMLRLPALTREERDVLLTGCLMNYYAG